MRLCILMLVLLSASGCATSEWVASRSNPYDLALASTQLADHDVTVEWTGGTEEGRLITIRPDSTLWTTPADGLRVIPTFEVRSIRVVPWDPDIAVSRQTGQLVGMAAGAGALIALAVNAPESDGGLFAPNFGLMMIGAAAYPVVWFTGYIGRESSGRRTVWFEP